MPHAPQRKGKPTLPPCAAGLIMTQAPDDGYCSVLSSAYTVLTLAAIHSFVMQLEGSTSPLYALGTRIPALLTTGE